MVQRHRLVQDTVQAVRTWIGSELEPGAKLPPEMELAARFDVSRTTLREALSELAAEGSVLRRWGVGTFAASGPASAPLDVAEIVPLRDAIRATGHEPQLGRVAIASVPADPTVASTLGLPDGVEVWAVERVFTLDGRAAVLLRDWLPQAVAGRRVDPEPLRRLEGDVLDLLLEQTRTRVVRMHARIEAVSADRAVANLLEVSKAAPLVRSIQTSHSDAGDVAIYSESYYSTDIVALTFVRTTRGARTGTVAGSRLGAPASAPRRSTSRATSGRN